MESADKFFEKTYDVEQMAVIGKLHNMQWLKTNSQLSGHAKTRVDEREITLKCELNEGTTNTKVCSTNSISDSLELENNDFVADKNIDSVNTVIHTDTLAIATVADIPGKDMETVWNKDVNVTSALFSNSESSVTQRLDEQSAMSMNLTGNIVTTQLEQLKLNERENSKFDESHNKGENDWDTNNVSDSQKSNADVGNQMSSKQCHDNNNNNAKSKAQATSEVKKGVQKTNTKINTKKLSDQNTRKQAGNSSNDPSIISKQGSKDKDDPLDSSTSIDKTSTPSDSKKLSVGVSPRFNEKGGKINGCNKLSAGKGAQMKDQQFYKQHFSTLNNSRHNSSMEGLDERNRSATKLRSSRNESDKKYNEVDDTRKCHKVQLTRVQSYNVQYIRSKSMIKSNQRCLRNETKAEGESSIKHTSGLDNKNGVSNTNENLVKNKYEDQQTVINKQISDKQSGQTLGKGSKDLSSDTKSPSSVPYRKSYQNLSNAKSIDRDVKDDQGYAQKFKRDSNTYRRSTGSFQTFSKNLNSKVRTDDHKKNVTPSMDAKICSPPDSSRIPIYLHKAVNGASNTNKTDTSDSSSVNIVQSLSSCSTGTKDSPDVDTSRTLQEPQTLQASCNEIEVQFTKTEQEASINNSNNKASTGNSEAKSVKFSDNVQEINMADHSGISYTENPVQQKYSTNPFYSSLQSSCSISDAQRVENHQTVQNKSYFGHNNAQYSNMSANIQHSEGDFYLLDIAQQKSEQVPHMSSPNVSPHSNCNSVTIPYQNMPAMYLNQYSNVQTVPRKTAESTIISHTLVPSTSTYTMESQNIMQSEPSSIFVHNTQPSILPPPGFHNHPVSTQHSQWNLPHPDMLLFGNMINPTPSLNMQLHNSRHLCNTDYNNIQQAGYLQHPLFYVPQMCTQNWNPLLQYPTVYQNPPYTSCSAFPNQTLPPNSLADSVSYPASTVQNNSFKQFQQIQQLENNASFVPVKFDSYADNSQAGKSMNVRVKDNVMRANQYRSSVPNEYQSYSQDAQLMVPYSYAVAVDSIARNVPSNMHMQQMNQKYAPRALNAASYQRMIEACASFQNQDGNSRKDDTKMDECIPPMVSPRECMYYGMNYSRKPDTVQNSSLRSMAKPVAYMQSVHQQQYVPQHQRHATYQMSPKECAPKMLGRGTRKMMEQ